MTPEQMKSELEALRARNAQLEAAISSVKELCDKMRNTPVGMFITAELELRMGDI